MLRTWIVPLLFFILWRAILVWGMLIITIQ